jgi:CubicO group peptidase (beta-lactamase class C family)
VSPLHDYSYTIDYVEYQVEALMDDHDIPSIAIALIDGEDIIYEEAFGYANLKEETLATLDTVYKIGSITKVFTAIEIMRMAEEGLIDLDAPIEAVLPDFSIQGYDPSSDPITIRSLLNHRSGLPRGDCLVSWHWDAKPHVLKAQVDSLAESYLAHPVWSSYKYSNIGYEILGRIIEVVRGVQAPSPDAVSGFPYYMRENILLPLGMEDTQFGSDLLLYGRDSGRAHAMGYYEADGKQTLVNQFDIIALASGNMQSTLEDMEAFMVYMMNLEGQEDPIISPESFAAMVEARYHEDWDPQANGLGFFTDTDMVDELLVFHDGGNQGFISLIMMVPDHDLGLVILSNSDSLGDLGYHLGIDLLRLMVETKTGKVYEDKLPKAAIDIEPSVLERYTGKYVARGEIVDIVLDGDQLKAVYQDYKIKMVPIGTNKFRLTSRLADVENITLEFWVDDPVEEDLMILTMGDRMICPRYPVLDQVPDLWNDLAGTYDLIAFIPSVYSEDEVLGRVEISIDDGVLTISDGKVILPVDQSWIRIVGGVFDGERMDYDSASGTIRWQHLVYKPINE